jgi:hypothetical protein
VGPAPHYFFGLTRRLAAAWGVPVAWDDYESGVEGYAADLIREQLDDLTAATWEARGWLPPTPPPSSS